MGEHPRCTDETEVRERGETRPTSLSYQGVEPGFEAVGHPHPSPRLRMCEPSPSSPRSCRAWPPSVPPAPRGSRGQPWAAVPDAPLLLTEARLQFGLGEKAGKRLSTSLNVHSVLVWGLLR